MRYKVLSDALEATQWRLARTFFYLLRSVLGGILGHSEENDQYTTLFQPKIVFKMRFVAKIFLAKDPLKVAIKFSCEQANLN